MFEFADLMHVVSHENALLPGYSDSKRWHARCQEKLNAAISI
jgi:hypothetical protein